MKKFLIILLIVIIIAVIIFIVVKKHSESVSSQRMIRDKMKTEEFKPDTLRVCSFNIQFLGHFKKRDDAALADILKGYDIIVVQELVAPPYDGVYPDGSPYTGDKEAAEFFDAMQSHGFSNILSEEDTGTGDKIHKKSSSTEWFVTFYNPKIVTTATDLPRGFLAEDRSNNPDFERVPYAFPFRTISGGLDFVFISVHLQPGSSRADRERRAHELASIAEWIDTVDDVEKDFIILGDMNIYTAKELETVTLPGFLSLNDECRLTNSLSVEEGKGKPYDHVMYNMRYTTEIDQSYDLTVVNLVEAMRPYWSSTEPYPGDPYVHNTFKQYYSDHFPVVFQIIVPRQDDDGAQL